MAAVARLNAEIAPEAVPQWRAVLDALADDISLRHVAMANTDQQMSFRNRRSVGHVHLPLPWSRRRTRRYRAYVG